MSWARVWVRSRGAIAVVSLGWSTATAGVIDMTGAPALDAMPFTVGPDMSPSTPAASDRILREPRADMAFPSLGVMSLLPGTDSLHTNDAPGLIDARDLFASDITIGPLVERMLPLEVPQLNNASTRGTILDVLFVIPSPGASAMVMLGCCGAVRRKR